MDAGPLLQILLVFAGVLAANRCRLPLGVALLLGGVVLDLWGGSPPVAVVSHLRLAFLRPELWLLVVNITLIVEVGHFMATRENAQAVINAARRWGGRHGGMASLVAIPAVIGLVPMPGGALVSAPLVGDSLAGSSRPPAWKAAVNYWFRHVFEYWWPLYPVVIVTLSIFAVETWQFMAMQIPLTVLSIAAGYVFLLRPHQAELVGGALPEPPPAARLHEVVGPLCLIVLATLLLPGLCRPWLPATMAGGVRQMAAMLVGLAGALIWIAFLARHDAGRRMFGLVFTAKSANIVVTLMGVVLFQNLLESSGLLPAASRHLAASQVPVMAIIVLLPFVAGLVTGIAVGFAAVAFPLVAGFVAVSQGALTPLAVLGLAFCAGYVGMMLSPVHLCFVLTSEFFVVPWGRVYRHILPCAGVVLGGGVLLHFLLRMAGW
ncbi:MAG: DUF401 family protein [Thermodesulfobacteriota bacterium]